MMSGLQGPRELVLLMRVVALLGLTKVGYVAYFDLLNPTPESAEERAAGEAEARRLAEEGEAFLLGRYLAKATLVERAAERCVGNPEPTHTTADCRFARLWTERYQARTAQLLRVTRDTSARRAALGYATAERLLGLGDERVGRTGPTRKGRVRTACGETC